MVVRTATSKSSSPLKSLEKQTPLEEIGKKTNTAQASEVKGSEKQWQLGQAQKLPRQSERVGLLPDVFGVGAADDKKAAAFAKSLKAIAELAGPLKKADDGEILGRGLYTTGPLPDTLDLASGALQRAFLAAPDSQSKDILLTLKEVCNELLVDSGHSGAFSARFEEFTKLFEKLGDTGSPAAIAPGLEEFRQAEAKALGLNHATTLGEVRKLAKALKESTVERDTLSTLHDALKRAFKTASTPEEREKVLVVKAELGDLLVKSYEKTPDKQAVAKFAGGLAKLLLKQAAE